MMRRPKVKFFDDYRTKELAGKDAVFDIKIKDIQERVKKAPQMISLQLK